MKVGMVLPEAGQQATRENLVQAAKRAEEEGFDSLWTWERLICPLKPQTPYPLTPDGNKRYGNMLLYSKALFPK